MANNAYRQTRHLPSLKKHGFSAVLLVALIALSTYSWMLYSGKRVNFPKPSNAEYKLPEIDKTATVTPAAKLPDLLEQDNIPPDANPTEALDLIGAPKSQSPQPNAQNETQPSGPRPPATSAPIINSGPATILIDGQPVTQNNSNPSSTPLSRAPLQGLTRMSPFGRVPHRASDGRTVLSSYAKPFAAMPNKNYISLVIGGLGLNIPLTKRAINELPGEISLSFAAEAPNLQSWVNLARAKGHEVLIELPMEGETIDASAIHTLTKNGPDSTNIKNLDFLLSRAEGYFAVTNYGGEVLVKNEQALSPILTHIKNAGIGFIYDGATDGARIESLGHKYGMSIVSAAQLIDDGSQEKASVIGSITTLQNSHLQTIPIGMGFSFGGTIDAITAWLSNKPGTIELAPVSYALKKNI